MSKSPKDQFTTFSKSERRSHPITFWQRVAVHGLIAALCAGSVTLAQNQGNGQQGQDQGQGQGQGQNGDNQGRGPNIVDVGGPLTPGFARPPLLANVQPGQTGSYTPAQIRQAYGFDKLTADGSGQTIGIVDAYGNASIQSDLDTFCAQFGLSSTTVRVIGTTSRNTGWALETALDVEWAHVIAPKASIILSVARSASINDLLSAVSAAVSAGANVISMSWGASEFSGEASYETYFQQPGVTYVASSGDNGELTGSVEVEWPAASPSVVSVGGTSLYTDASGNYLSETGWGSGGGGLSHYFSRPSWQVNWNTFSVNQRGVPDVSYLADPNTGVQVYDSVNRGWWIVGGTSAGAPQWAALIALANQLRSSGVNGNASIYSVAGTGTPGVIDPSILHDIASGSNGSHPDDVAVGGYDLVTGLGSPNAGGVVSALVSAAPAPPDFSISLAPNSKTTTPGGSASYTLTVSYTGGFNQQVNLTSTGMPKGATFSPAFVTAPGSYTLTITTAARTSPLSYTFQVTGTSADSSLFHSASATLVVANPDFTISASPTSQTVRHGNSTSYTVTVGSLGGFTGPVGLNVSGFGAGASGSFSPASIAGAGSSTLHISTASSASRGTVTLTITGTSGSLSHTTTVSLTVN